MQRLALLFVFTALVSLQRFEIASMAVKAIRSPNWLGSDR